MSNIRAVLLLLVSLSFSLGQAFAVEIEGVQVPDTVSVKSHALSLNGVGIRKAGFLFVKVKIYVAALFTEKKSSDANELLSSTEPKRVELVFLRNVIDRDVREAWKFQFKESASLTYPELSADLQKLLTFMEAIKEGDKQSFEIVDEVTRFYVNDTLKGEIKGVAFQKAFLSIWIGENPAQKDLKAKLLGL